MFRCHECGEEIDPMREKQVQIQLFNLHSFLLRVKMLFSAKYTFLLKITLLGAENKFV